MTIEPKCDRCEVSCHDETLTFVDSCKACGPIWLCDKCNAIHESNKV